MYQSNKYSTIVFDSRVVHCMSGRTSRSCQQELVLLVLADTFDE
jgi:hypothetical protein